MTSMTASSSSSTAASASAASTSSSSVSADHTGSSCSTSQSNSSEAATDGDHLDSGSRALCEVDTASSTTAIAQCAEYLDGDGDDAATVSVCEDLSL